jgi:hypothetical protein
MGVQRFLLFTKHYIKVANERRIHKVEHEVQRAGEKREVWKSMNALIRTLQVAYLSDNEVPCNVSQLSMFCQH